MDALFTRLPLFSQSQLKLNSPGQRHEGKNVMHTPYNRQLDTTTTTKTGKYNEIKYKTKNYIQSRFCLWILKNKINGTARKSEEKRFQNNVHEWICTDHDK